MKETFSDFFPKRKSAPFHRHNFELVSKIKLFPIIDNKQFYKVKEKCTICGKTIEFESWDYSI